MRTELKELVDEIRLAAKMCEMFHGEYKYQGWVHMWREWANRIEKELENNARI